MPVRFVKGLYKLRRNGYSGPFFVALTMMAVGIQFLVPNSTFETGRSYAIMADWASEPAWGIFLVACSLHLMVSSLKRKPEMVSVGSLVAAFGWLVMWVSVVLGNPRGALMPITLVMTLRCMSLFREFSDRRYDPHLIGPESEDTYPRKQAPEDRAGPS